MNNKNYTKKTKKTILLVDDQPEQIDIFKTVLDQHYAVKIVTRGALAVNIAETGNVDLILLDIMMPDVDGFEICRQLKSNTSTRDIPIIFLTCKESYEDETMGLTLGAVDFIRKPSNASIVLSRVQNTIAHRQARDELRIKNEQLQQALKIREDVERIAKHDIKGPLSGILGIVEVLLDDGEHLSDWHKKLVKMIENSSYTLMEMINRSLDLFKMETGVYQLQPETIDLTVILERVTGDLGKFSEPKGVHIKIDFFNNLDDQDPFLVYGEKMLCYPLFYNLVLNAIEASNNNSSVIILLSVDRGRAIIQVTNTGEVPRDIRDRFFDKYVTSGKRSGTGLGTYSAWLAVRIQGGTIELDTRQIGETTVRVSLPIGILDP